MSDDEYMPDMPDENEEPYFGDPPILPDERYSDVTSWQDFVGTLSYLTVRQAA